MTLSTSSRFGSLRVKVDIKIINYIHHIIQPHVSYKSYQNGSFETAGSVQGLSTAQACTPERERRETSSNKYLSKRRAMFFFYQRRAVTMCCRYRVWWP